MTTFDQACTIVGPPVHRWKFDDANPALANDTGSDPDTDFTSGVGTYTAQVLGPLQDGSGSYGVQFTDGFLNRGTGLSTNDFPTSSASVGSITWWFKSSSATNQGLWGGHPDNKNFTMYLVSDGTLFFQVINGSASSGFGTSGTDYADGQWHFCCLVCDGTNPNKLYVDGAEVTFTYTPGTTNLTDHAWLGSLSSDTTANFGVGNDTRYATTIDYPFVGAISELAFWADALSLSDVELLWASAFGYEALPSGTIKSYLDLDLPMTNSVYMAQRIAYRRLLQSTRQRVLAVPVNLRAMRYAVGDVLTVTIDDLSIAEETFRVSGWRRTQDEENGTIIEMSLRQDDSSAYLDPLPAMYKQPAALPTLTGGTPQVPPPTALAAAAALEGIQLSWTAPDNILGVHHYAIYSNTSSAWSGATLIGTTLSTTFLHVLASTVTRYYWVRAVDSSGYESIRSPDSDTSTVSATYTAGTIATPSAAQTLGGIDGTPSTGQLTGVFKRAGVTVASRVFTATHSGGNLTVTAAADTGEATTYTLSGDGTPTVVVTQRHTGSGAVNGTMTFTVAP